MSGVDDWQMIIVAIGLLALGTAALLTIIRIARGPSMLDRVVATDVLIAITIVGLVLEATINRHASTVPVILALALVGFAGSASVAQFVAGREGRRGGIGGIGGTGGTGDTGDAERSRS